MSCQMLSELEEVIQYKLVPERRDIIRETWWERLQVSAAADISPHELVHAHTHSHTLGFTHSRAAFICETDVGRATVTNGKHCRSHTDITHSWMHKVAPDASPARPDVCVSSF